MRTLDAVETFADEHPEDVLAGIYLDRVAGFLKGNAMRAIDLVEATTVAWERLSPQQRDRFFRAFVSAALRLDRVAMRDWLRKRLRNRPLAAPVDLTRFTF